MAHKFADYWNVFTMDDRTNPPTLVYRGRLDLRTMDENGILANGSYHEQATGTVRPIRGKVHEIGDWEFLVLSHADASARYRGQLSQEVGNQMKIFGTRFTPTQVSDRERTFLVQDEEPWLITKP